MVAASKLDARHEVTLFEANDYPGGHTNTVVVNDGSQQLAIDTGFIVYNDRTYPNFIELLDELGVESRPTEMSFSVSDPETGLEYNGHSLNSLFAQRSNLFRPRFLRMIRDIIRFNREAKTIAFNDGDSATVGRFLESRNYGPEFANYYLLPMGAAIWSCPTGTFADFPIEFVASFFSNHGLLNIRDRPTWRVISGGSKSYVDRLINPLRERVRLRSAVTEVRRVEDTVWVTVGDQPAESFDHVVFACHADQALEILGSGATATETDVLSAFPYSRNVAVLHTDSTLLPNSRRAWASWNVRLSPDRVTPAAVTYNMNILQHLRSTQTWCVTLNSEQQIAPDKIHGRFEYFHPIFSTRRKRAQSRHFKLLGVNRTSFCGAYWRNGFHEDGVVSALAVVEVIDQLSGSKAATAVGAGR